MISHNTKDPPRSDNFKPDIVGGYDLTSIKPLFDLDDTNIILASNRQLIYYDVKTCKQVGKACISSTKLSPAEKIVSCDRLDGTLYIATKYGRIFSWNLKAKDWTNELVLPLEEKEVLIACKMLSKRQYFYSVQNEESNKISLYYSMSRSERERPKQREAINECISSDQTTFDIGCLMSQDDLEDSTENKTNKNKLAKQRCLFYINGPILHMLRVAINEKLSTIKSKQRIQGSNFTCVKACSKKPMVAAGDSSGRIYLYTGDFVEFKTNRTKLHWHTLPVNDLAFSNTGNTLFSVGGESGCVVVWDVSQNNFGQKRIIARLGMPIRYVNCSNILNQLVLSFEDNEIQFVDTNGATRHFKTLTKRTIDMYKENNYKVLRSDSENSKAGTTKSMCLMWHSKTDTVVSNGKTGSLQFYSPRLQSRLQAHNYLKSNILSLEKEAVVVPSDITKATMTLDGDWLAFYETRQSDNFFPDVKLHIWQRSSLTQRWAWIQTADRLHSSTSIADLRFSSDGQFLLSVGDDGTFNVLHRICLDAKETKKKQMYARGFVGHVPKNLPAMVAFSQDSSVMAMSLKNNTTLIWMIVDPFKLVYECQLNQINMETENHQTSSTTDSSTSNNLSRQQSNEVLGLHFGFHQPSQSLAPLCEVRGKSIRIWNILDQQEVIEYPSAMDSSSRLNNDIEEEEFTAATFDQCSGSDGRSPDHFAVSTRKNEILIFKLEIDQTTRALKPIIIVDVNSTLSSSTLSTYYTDMCFMRDPILDIDLQSYHDPQVVKLLNRLCLMNNRQELISLTDKLTLERQSACNSCNAIKTLELNELQEYFVKNVTNYIDESRNQSSTNNNRTDLTIKMTEKQRRIRNRLEVQKMLKDLFVKVPSHVLPKMDVLGPMILDKTINMQEVSRAVEAQEQVKNGTTQVKENGCKGGLTELDAFLYGLPVGLLISALLLLCFIMFGNALTGNTNRRDQPSASSNTRLTRNKLLGKKKNRGPPPSVELRPVDMNQMALSDDAPDDIKAMALAGKLSHKTSGSKQTS